MNKRIIKASCSIFTLCMVITGCDNSLKNENTILNEEIIVLKEKNAELEKSINSLSDTLKEYENRKAKEKEEQAELRNNMYPIYTANVDTYKKEVGTYIYLPKEADLKEKLSNLAKGLSEVYFNNLPIEIVSIEEVDKNKILVVNLRESEDNQEITDPSKFKGSTWANSHLQGSTGGAQTSTMLIETMLQKEHEGEWVDGVKFLYSNGACNFEHAPNLANINYRK
ncbi:hypothetical protein [Clostridium sp.]|uniref:hypothetical protein n=1 Tax=Clostridium sp. TaxID=1506 RepID=UPI002FCA515A